MTHEGFPHPLAASPFPYTRGTRIRFRPSKISTMNCNRCKPSFQLDGFLESSKWIWIGHCDTRTPVFDESFQGSGFGLLSLVGSIGGTVGGILVTIIAGKENRLVFLFVEDPRRTNVYTDQDHQSSESQLIDFRLPSSSPLARPVVIRPRKEQSGMASPSKRRDMDVMKLMMADYKVEMIGDSMSELFVEFHGPPDSLYVGGVWKVRVDLPDSYPYKSPSIGFVNRIYHPNIDEASGSVCLDVINQTWSPMFDLVNIFEVFLPQLLLYPNPSDPLNGEAAAYMLREREAYEQRVKEHCARYAKPSDANDGSGDEDDGLEGSDIDDDGDSESDEDILI